MNAPSGIVTFLFTDVEGSTRRWEADAELRNSLYGRTIQTSGVHLSAPWVHPLNGPLRQIGLASAIDSCVATADTADAPTP